MENEIKTREQVAIDTARETIVTAITAKIGVNESIARPIAEAVLDALRETLSGRQIWIPAKSREDRNDRIRTEFNGRNRVEIMKKHDLSRAQFYRIIGRGRTR